MDTRKFRNPPAESGGEPAPAVLSLEQARAMLSRAAFLLDHVVVTARDVLASTPLEVARAVFMEDKPVDVEPLASPQKRPRGRMHPLLALVKLGLSAARLQKQVLVTLFPELANSPEQDVSAAAESLAKMVNDLQGMAKDIGLDSGA